MGLAGRRAAERGPAPCAGLDPLRHESAYSIDFGRGERSRSGMSEWDV